MDIKDIAIPEIYKTSADFRFFLDWIQQDLKKTQYDTENFFDLYDPLRCPQDLLWALADTIGYKYDTRMPTSYNRLVLLYFMSLIRNRGSKDGVTLAAEVNLAQFKVLRDAQGYTDEEGNVVPGKEILYNRLEDTSIPVNTVYVTPHVDKGYIDLVYFSTRVPEDICIEYVRPLGMFLFQNAGVSFDARTKITIDARLTDSRDSITHNGQVGLSANFGPTQVGHYTRKDYASMAVPTSTEYLEYTGDKPYNWDSIYHQFYVLSGSQYTLNQQDDWEIASQEGLYLPVARDSESRELVASLTQQGWKPDLPLDEANPGQRSLYSLQLANNANIVAALLDPIFSIGYGIQQDDVVDGEVNVIYPKDYLSPEFTDRQMRLMEDGSTQPDDWIYNYNTKYYVLLEDGNFILNKLANWTNATKQGEGLYREEIVNSPYNLRYDKGVEVEGTETMGNVTSYDPDEATQTPPQPTPHVNPIMRDDPDSADNIATLGDELWKDGDI